LGLDASTDRAEDVWGNPSVTAPPTEPQPAVGIPESWFHLDTRCPTALPEAPPPTPPPAGITKWWLQLDGQCPTALAEEPNEQLARKRRAESLRARKKRKREGKGGEQSPWGFDLRAMAEQMEELATTRSSDRLYLPNISKKRQKAVGFQTRIICL